MKTLRQLALYNDWANQRVFDICAAASTQDLSQAAKGTVGSVGETLAHLVEVEDVYLLMLQGRDPGDVTDDDDYLSHDTPWFAQRSLELGKAYQAMLSKNDEAWLESTFSVPWFGFALSRRDGLLQVWTHSAQHRAQVLSALGSHDIEVPDVDYIFMLSLEPGAKE